MYFPKRELMLVALLALLASGSDAARSQVKPNSYAVAIKSGCADELARLCKDVTGGEGRLLACLYAHENKLSDSCGTIVMSSLERLGIALGALANVVRACQPDAQRLCNGVIAGNGNLVGCLSSAKQSVSPQCNATLDAALLTGSGDQ